MGRDDMAKSVKLPDKEPHVEFRDWLINRTAEVFMAAEDDGATYDEATVIATRFMEAVRDMMARRLWQRFNDLPVEPWPKVIRF